MAHKSIAITITVDNVTVSVMNITVVKIIVVIVVIAGAATTTADQSINQSIKTNLFRESVPCLTSKSEALLLLDHSYSRGSFIQTNTTFKVLNVSTIIVVIIIIIRTSQVFILKLLLFIKKR